MADPKLYSERTNFRVFTFAIIALVIGLLLLGFAAYISNDIAQNILVNLGSLLLGSVALSLLWELRVKRAFLDELLAKAGISADVRQAGIADLTNNFQYGIDWQSLFKNVRELDIFFSYGRTWRGAHAQQLRAITRTSNFRVRVILPDPEDEHIMKELAKRFSKTPEEVSKLILEAKDDFIDIFGNSKNGNFSLWYLSISPVYSFYRFDHKMILALYTHRGGRGVVPTFMLEEGGTIHSFLNDELEKCLDKQQGVTRRVFPIENP